MKTKSELSGALELDLSKNYFSDPELAKLFADLSYESRESFNELIHSVSQHIPENKKLYWWVGSPASRNTLNSVLFINYCKIELVKYLINKGGVIKKIYMESKGLYDVINQIPSIDQYEIILGKSRIRKLKDFVRPIIRVVMQIFDRVCKMIIYKIYIKKSEIKCTTPITLIDIFAFPGFYSKDRYYTSIQKYLTDEDCKRLYYVPTIVMTGLLNIYNAYKEIIKSEKNILFKESYLEIKDIIYASLYPLKAKLFKVRYAMSNGMDYMKLINEDMHSDSGHILGIEGILNYRFIKRLSEKGVKVSKIIDWWESQALDKGFNYGISKYYPDVEVIGYLGYAPREFELQLYPTKYEVQYGVVPNRIAVIGKGFIEGLKQFNKSLDVVVAPAFRFNHVWQEEECRSERSTYTILIPLTISYSESINILEIVLRALSKINIRNICIIVKKHPTMSTETIMEKVGSEKMKYIKFSDIETSTLLRNVDMIISGMSTICLEGLALGIPVLVIKRNDGLHYNPIPNEIPEDIWRLCETSEQIIEYIHLYKNRSVEEIEKHKRIGADIRNLYFEPLSKKEIKNFIR